MQQQTTEKREQPIESSIYYVTYDGQQTAVAEYEIFEDRTVIYPSIPVDANLYYKFLLKQADNFGIKTEIVEKDNEIFKLVIYKNEYLSDYEKNMFKSSIDWVFKKSIEKIKELFKQKRK